MLEFEVYAQAFRYPAPGSLESLSGAVSRLPAGKHKTALTRFISAVEKIELGAWEELYTRTWDLNPMAAPYIGYHVWGDHYRRGEFMARLRQAYKESRVPQEGEMPDHLVLILSYLSRVEQPIDELLELLPESFKKIHAGLRKNNPENPYLVLIDALRQEEWGKLFVKESL